MTVQSYPRVSDGKYDGFLDIDKLKKHRKKLPYDELKAIIRSAIELANRKSSRVILNVPEFATSDDKKDLYKKKGKELFKYFAQYYGDPANTAFDCLGRHYSDVAKEQFRNQTLQKERMNSGWRYQYIAKDCAVQSRRFETVSDIGSAEGDFNASILIEGTEIKSTLNLYVSVKNRMNTMGGQDWPKAIYALETIARTDKNRSGPYICIFGIAMQKGQRSVKTNQKTKSAYSVNTEVWLSDFFWPFFSNFSYKEIVTAVLEILLEKQKERKTPIDDVLIPDIVIETFGQCCAENGLLDKEGKFNDPHSLLDLFVDKK